MLLCQGHSTKTFLGLLPTLGPFLKPDPSVQLAKGNVWLMSVCLSPPGQRHRFGRDLVCWQDTAFKNADATWVIPRSAMQLPEARGPGTEYQFSTVQGRSYIGMHQGAMGQS